jgi:hypothetical protein
MDVRGRMVLEYFIRNEQEFKSWIYRFGIWVSVQLS